MNDLGPKADGIKYDKDAYAPPMLEDVGSIGVGPFYKRKKSFWRAARRGELWAIVSLSFQAFAHNLVANLYGIKEENIIRDKWIPSDVVYLIRKNK
jgi:hypothetical protein